MPQRVIVWIVVTVFEFLKVSKLFLLFINWKLQIKAHQVAQKFSGNNRVSNCVLGSLALLLTTYLPNFAYFNIRLHVKAGHFYACRGYPTEMIFNRLITLVFKMLHDLMHVMIDGYDGMNFDYINCSWRWRTVESK